MAMSIKDVVNAKQSPWQNPFVERAIGTRSYLSASVSSGLVAQGSSGMRAKPSGHVKVTPHYRHSVSFGGGPREVIDLLPMPVETDRTVAGPSPLFPFGGMRRSSLVDIC